jgi:hypothetical protein
MAQMTVSEGGRYVFPYTITSALDDVNVGTLNTTNKFVDKDIDIKLTLAEAAATVSASKQATTPTITRTTATVSGATNVGSVSATTSAPNSGYFVSMTATAPATTLDITKTIDTAGYLGANGQITASAATTAKTSGTYYLPITTGVAAGDAASATISIEATDSTSINGVNVKSVIADVNGTTTEPSSGYFLCIKAGATGNSKVTTAGWFPTGSLASKSGSTTKYYQVTSAAASVSGTKAATAPTIARTGTTASGATNVGSSNATTTAPSSGYYISMQATAPATTIDLTKAVSTAGYLGETAQITASAATTSKTGSIYYIPITSGVAAANTASAEITKTTTDSSSVGGNNVGQALLGDRTNSEPTSGYYISFQGSGSGSSKITTAGWMPTGNLTAASTTVERFFPVNPAVATLTGTNTVTPSVNITQSNVTLGTSNTSGISVTATGGGTASASVATNITTAGYAPNGDNFVTNTIAASNNTTSSTKYITAVTITSGKSLSISNAGTATMTANSGTTTISNTGTVTVTQGDKSGTVKVNAYELSTSTDLLGEKTIVSGGVWSTTAASGAGTYYGRVTVNAVSGSIGGSAASGTAKAVITNTNSVNTITTLTNKTAGTDYWEIKATATGTAGSYTPKYTVSTAGWIASTVTGTAQTVSVTGDSTGKSIYIPRATFSVSANKVYCSSAGYIPAGSASSPVYTISTGTISTSTTDPGNTHTANTTAVVPSGGYLLLSAGYYSATKISLATLVPNGSNVAGHADYLLEGKTAYDNNGVLVTGNIPTYQGDYTYAS